MFASGIADRCRVTGAASRASASTTRTNHWKQAAEFFPQPIAVQPGDRFLVIAGYDNTRIFFKSATL